MVKGITRRVIVVKSPDPRLFEEAIFIVREDVLAKSGVTADAVLEEARRVADEYVRRQRGCRWSLPKLPTAAAVLIGALSTGLIWLATVLI